MTTVTSPFGLPAVGAAGSCRIASVSTPCARALYLFRNGKDTLYRIHGTTEPWSIGEAVSSGCIRMMNQDVIDLYGRIPNGAKVVVLPAD